MARLIFNEGYKWLWLKTEELFKRRARHVFEKQSMKCCSKRIRRTKRRLIPTGGQYRLAAMGIRALLEQVMIQKVGDLKTFDMKLDEFQKQGYISAIQRDAMRATLDVGDAAMHRAFVPTEQDLTLALDIVEGVLAPIYDHRTEVEKMADRVPPRAPRLPERGK
jgi:hypothetical protein